MVSGRHIPRPKHVKMNARSRAQVASTTVEGAVIRDEPYQAALKATE